MIDKKFAYEMAKRFRLEEVPFGKRSFKFTEGKECPWWNCNFFLHDILGKNSISIWFNDRKEVEILSNAEGNFEFVYKNKFKTKKEMEKFIRFLARELKIK